EVDVSAVSAEVTTSGVLGEQRLSAVSGDITAEFAGDLEVKTISGEVKLKGHGQPARLHVSSVSGDVRLEHGAGDLEAGTTSGCPAAPLRSPPHSSSGTPAKDDTIFPGRRTAPLIASGCRKSCCSRPKSRPSCPITGASWSASRMCARSPRPRWMRCCTSGPG